MPKTRLITGVIFVIVVIGLIMFDDVTASALLLIIAAMCTFEYTNISRRGIKDPTFNLTLACGIGPLIFSLIKPEFAEGYEFTILMVSFIFLMSISIFSVGLNIRTNHNMLSPLICLIYIGLPFAAIDRLMVHGETYLETILIGIMISLWVTDTGAYVVGRKFGKTPLHRRVSPKKTIEGSLGAGVFAFAAAFVLNYFFEDLSLQEWLIITLTTWIAGTWGDLFESSIKRQFEVKDSGTLLPGHGGFLDRFDSFIFAAPAVLLILFSFYEY